MRYLVLTLTLLFFTGTHGRFLWPQDEPNPLDHYVQKALNAALVVGSAALKTMKETELGKQLK
ncbi:hypothetical protein FKM82_030305 [Ascaphus truei]